MLAAPRKINLKSAPRNLSIQIRIRSCSAPVPPPMKRSTAPNQNRRQLALLPTRMRNGHCTDSTDQVRIVRIHATGSPRADLCYPWATLDPLLQSPARTTTAFKFFTFFSMRSWQWRSASSLRGRVGWGRCICSSLSLLFSGEGWECGGGSGRLD